MVGLVSIAGFGEILLGFVMTVLLGGSASLSLNRFIAHLTHSKQVIEILENPTKTGRVGWHDRVFWLYMPGLVFVSAVFLGWDVYNADSPQAGFLQPTIHSLDIFSKPVGTNPMLYSHQLIPALVILTALAGFTPAMVVPYFGKFKVTGINAGPFNSSLLFSTVSALAGLGIILTLVGLFYRSLWLNREPLPYHFGLLALLGFAIHFSLGMYIGRHNAEVKILDSIRRSGSGRRMILS